MVVDNNDSEEDVMTPVFKADQGSTQETSESYRKTVGQTRDETQRHHQSIKVSKIILDKPLPALS